MPSINLRDLIGSKSSSTYPSLAVESGNSDPSNPLGDRFDDAAQPRAFKRYCETIFASDECVF